MKRATLLLSGKGDFFISSPFWKKRLLLPSFLKKATSPPFSFLKKAKLLLLLCEEQHQCQPSPPPAFSPPPVFSPPQVSLNFGLCFSSSWSDMMIMILAVQNLVSV